MTDREIFIIILFIIYTTIMAIITIRCAKICNKYEGYVDQLVNDCIQQGTARLDLMFENAKLLKRIKQLEKERNEK